MGSILAGGAIKAIGGATQAITGLVNAKGLKREQREKLARENEKNKKRAQNHINLSWLLSPLLHLILLF